MQSWTARAPTSATEAELVHGTGWNRYYSQATIGREPAGPIALNGAFAKARELVTAYQFSDPRIVRGYFDASLPLLGRTMLLQISAFGLHYLCGVRVTRVRDTTEAQRTVFGLRYDTLEGHIERGAEWFVVTKHHETGDVEFRIEAAWRPGTFPNWWSRVGFAWIGPRFQRAWHRLSYLRLRKLLASTGLPPLPRGRGLLHPGVPIEAPPVAWVGGGAPSTDLLEREAPDADLPSSTPPSGVGR